MADRKEGMTSASRRDFLQGALAFGLLSRVTPAQPSAPPPTRDELWYDRPAERWLEALPVGNGRLGGMVYGGIQTERIALSESTAWSGAPATGEVNPEALPHLQEMRQLFFDGKYEEFQQLCNKCLPGHAKNFGTNLPLPELQLTFDEAGEASGYRRSLDLDSAIATGHYRNGNAAHLREVFASHPDKVLAIRLTCDKPRSISVRLSFGKSILPGSAAIDHDTLVFRGHAYETMHSSGHDGVAFQIPARAFAAGGTATPATDAINIQGASSVTILVAIATSFHG